MNGPQEWLYDPRLGQGRGLLDEDPAEAFRLLRNLREDYGWRDPELGAIEHEAFMRNWIRDDPARAIPAGLPAAFGYPMLKGTIQNPWTQPLLYLGMPGILGAGRAAGLDRASPATMEQFGSGLSGWMGGLLDWIER